MQTFTTFPDPSLQQPTHYTFASSSCVKAGFPWTGPQNKRSIKGAETFLKIAEKVGVRFMVFLGCVDDLCSIPLSLKEEN